MYVSDILFTFRNDFELFFSQTIFAESIYSCMSSFLFSKNRFARSFKTAYIQVLILFVQKQDNNFHCCSNITTLLSLTKYIELKYRGVLRIGLLYKFLRSHRKSVFERKYVKPEYERNIGEII